MKFDYLSIALTLSNALQDLIKRQALQKSHSRMQYISYGC